MAGEFNDLPLLIGLPTTHMKQTLYLFLCEYGNIERACWFVFVPAPYPLLPIEILQVVEVAVVPFDADAQQGHWEEAVLSQNHKVGEKTTKSLDHPWKQKTCT